MLDLAFIRRQLKEDGASNVRGVGSIIATQMIESWFFHDLEGIYNFLRVPKSQRKRNAFRPVEKYRGRDLKMLFQAHGKAYAEGERAKHFIESLDIVKIYNGAKALRLGVEAIIAGVTR